MKKQEIIDELTQMKVSNQERSNLSQVKITDILNEVPKKTNLLSAFQLKEISKPLTLYEEEQMANELLQNIVKQEREKDDRYKLPEHLEEFRRFLDPPSKVKKKLPIISQLSPRTKAKVSLLPKPNDYELQEIRNLEKMTKKAGTHAIYDELMGNNKLLTRPAPLPISRGGSRPTTTTPTPVGRSTSPNANQTNILPKPASPPISTSLKLSLLMDDEEMEKKLPSLIPVIDEPVAQPSVNQKPPAPISKLVPGENVPVEVVDRSSTFYKQADDIRRRKQKQEDILINLLGRNEDDEEDRQGDEEEEDHNHAHSNGWSYSEKGLLLPSNKKSMTQPASAVRAGTANEKASRSSLQPRLNFSKLGSSLFSTSLTASSNPYQALPTSSSAAKRGGRSQEAEKRYLNQFSAKVYDELGVHLNPEYNRMRHYRQSLRTFFYFKYSLKIREAMKKWHEVTLYYRRKQMERASWTIITLFRRAKYLRQKERKNRYLLLQQDQENQRSIKNQLFLKSQALIIFRAMFRFWKRTKIRRLMNRRRSTVNIQKGVRGFIARRRFQKKMAFLNFLRDNAVRIQCKYRIYLAKRKVHLIRKMKFITNYIEELNNKRLLHEAKFEKLGAVSRLIQSYRVFNMKKRLFNMLYWLKYSKAIIIQRHVRGYLIRKKHANFRFERMQRQQLEEKNAIIIQKYIRRYLAENRFIELMEEKEQKKQQHQADKLFFLASYEQSFIQLIKRSFLRLSRRLTPFRYLILNQKAIIIQRIYRGYHGRQRIKMVRVYNHLQAFYKRNRVFSKHCTKIQKVWRGFSARQKMKQKLRQRMAVKLQCAIRRFLAYRKFWKMKQIDEAARRITKNMRRLIIQHKFHTKYEREQLLGSVVGFLQNFFRKTLSIRLRQRKVLEMKKNYENNLNSQISLIHLLVKIQLKVLIETIRKPINKRYYTVSRQDCACFGPLQAIFVMLICGQTQKSRMELATITLNQIDNTRLLKFLTRIPFFMMQQKKKDPKDGGGGNASDPIFSINGVYNPDMLTSQKKEDMYLRYCGLIDILQKERKKLNFSAPKYHIVPQHLQPRPVSPSLPPALKLVKQKSTFRSQRSVRNLLNTANQAPPPGSKKPADKEKDAAQASAAIIQSSALLTALFTGDLTLPPIKHLLTSTEFDILFTKSKSATNGGNKISYEEFCRCVEYLCEIHYHSQDVNINQQLHNTNSAAGSIANTATNTATTNTVSNTEENSVASDTQLEEDILEKNTELNAAISHVPSNDSADTTETVLAFTSSEGPGTGMALEKFLAKQTDKLNRKSNLLNASSLTLENPTEALLGNEGQNMNYVLVMALRLLAFFHEDVNVRSLLQWLEKESYERLVVFVVKIQSVMRFHLAKRIVRERKKQKAFEDHQRFRIGQIVRIQALIRRFLVRCSIRQRIRETIVKYVPHLERPYYYNKKTGVKSFTRPKILSKSKQRNNDEIVDESEDCYSIAVPEPGLENVVNCYQCRYRQAVVFCQQCEDSMCMSCYQSLHYKGAKSKHSYQKIPKCSYCTYQIATKSCVTCVTHPPRPHSIQASKSTFSRGLYCDTCFLHEHDEYTQQLERSAEKRQQLKRLLQTNMTSQHPDVALLTKYLFQKIITNHYYEPLTMNCEECNVLSASWRCYACQQIYCHRCLIYLHSMNPIFAATHHLEPIGYYTAKMHKSLQKDLNQMYFVKKWEICLAKERQRTLRIEFKKAITIQSWWRMIFYGRKGRKYMQKQRFRKRKWWRLRQKETKEVRSKWSYQFSNLFGMAPVLTSDTIEEKVLKSLPAWKRQTAREFIWRNMADWGYYNRTAIGNKKRKGIPKKGFDVGDLKELSEQAKLLGDRLPGRVLVRTAENRFETTCDLSTILRPGEIIRIKRYLFGVVSVDSESIRLNRLWRESRRGEKKKDDDEESDEEEDEEDEEYDEDGQLKGEIAYRMPTYSNEKHQMYYRMQFLLFDLTIGNPLTQVGFFIYKQYCLRMMSFSLYMMRMNKRSKLYDESYQWKQAAVRYADGARRISAYFNTREALIDLSGVSLTDELKSKRFGDKKSSKKEKRKRLFDDDDEDEDDEEDDENEEEGRGRVHGGGDGEEDPLLSAKSMKYGKTSRRRKLFQSSSRRSGRAQKVSTVVPTDKDPEDDEDEGEDDNFDEEGENEQEQGEGGEGKEGDDKKKRKKEMKAKIKKARKDSVLNMFENLSMRTNRFGIVKSVAKSGKKKDDEEGEGKKRLGLFEQEIENVSIAKKNIKNPKYKSGLLESKPEKPWFPTKEQAAARRDREDKMSAAELALEADDWKEMIDPMTENVYYLNIFTNEMSTTVPRSITAKKQLEFENSKNKKSYDDAKRRIDHLELVTKKRLLISGYRKK